MDNNKKKVEDYLSPVEKELLESIRVRAIKNQELISNLYFQQPSGPDNEVYTLKEQIESDKIKLNTLRKKAATRRAIEKAKVQSESQRIKASAGKLYGLRQQRENQSS